VAQGDLPFHNFRSLLIDYCQATDDVCVAVVDVTEYKVSLSDLRLVGFVSLGVSVGSEGVQLSGSEWSLSFLQQSFLWVSYEGPRRLWLAQLSDNVRGEWRE
jgi:hypothetical protein